MKFTGRSPVRKGTGVAVVVVSLSMLLAACAGTTGTSGGTSSATAPSSGTGSAAPSTSSTVSADAMKEVLKKALNPDADPSALPPEVQSVLAAAATAPTADQLATWMHCISQTKCDLGGSGTKTLVVLDDDVNAFYSMEWGEALDQAIKSGQVKTIMHYNANSDLTQFLSNWRQAIAKKPDAIVGMFAHFGNQAAPVVAQAKAAGIAVANGPVAVPPEVAKNMAAEVSEPICSLFDSLAPTLTAKAKSDGVTNPTFAFFSGPKGNPYAASWQPCAQKAMEAAGWKLVYTGWDVWSPQGMTTASSQLLASGTNPTAILSDYQVGKFVDAYNKAGKKPPLMAIAGATDVNDFTQFKSYIDKGIDANVYTNSSQVWGLRIGVVAALNAASGQQPSANPIVYPLGGIDYKSALNYLDLTVPGTVPNGTLLTPAQQTEAVKH